jgi:hypothetical protein
LGETSALSDRSFNSRIGSELVGSTEARGGTGVYVGKGVGVDLGEEVGLGVQVGGKESEEVEGVSVSIRSMETLNVRFAHADRRVSSSKEMVRVPVGIFPLHPDLCNPVCLDTVRPVPEYSTVRDSVVSVP